MGQNPHSLTEQFKGEVYRGGWGVQTHTENSEVLTKSNRIAN